MKKRISFLLLMFLGIVILDGCTDLKEEILDESSTTGLSAKQAADGLIAPVYGRLFDLFNHTNYFNVQEISTDEAILPYRGGTDWGDNGIYIAMHQHNYTSTDPNLLNTWNLIFQGISRSLTAISELPANTDPSAKTYIAEARGMRAFYSMLSLDLFGVVYVKEDPKAVSKILRGSEAFDYIASELVAIEPDLTTTAGPGRLTKAGSWGLLARLYLNAAVYRDRYAASFTFAAADMDKVISYCDQIINSGQFQLSPDYFAVFGNDNHTNKELIFAIDQRNDLPGAHNRMSYFSISGDQFPLPAFPNANGTDGPAITSDFYQSWVDAYGADDPADVDPRFYKQNMDPSVTCSADFNINRGILRGPQRGLIRVNGAFVKCGDGTYQVGPLFYVTRNKPAKPVDFTLQVDYTQAGSDYNTGYRVEKYEFGRKSDSGRNKGDADISIVRLADIYLMRAEAKLRKNNDQSSALDDVNFVRAARTATTPAPALGEMNLDLLLRERGFEFYWEMLRRTDMIRFGKYEGTWTEKTNSDKNKRIFPIPQNAMDGASNIPGYLVQNPGY
ncbi:RagB/SusD family nutrient uptake outer membrane protein [Chryseolinea lacunae]|uniref:RagB/SusD family nutrient uptake outer membrane protein n=1 Tax=Chryseolinea lacunae TaxID=2801331 RepID=A0ABS1KKN8_9BACT|nr:RagB/SusD family nutrient uptake outer membrane protein [Chryseolinea lacunae]MBL0740025.1 RagB/SusD family nutrient uptake outer membrane protein [Chryseolinea lacunae]